MRKFIISTEKTCDLPNNLISEYNIYTTNMRYSIDDVEYGDDNDISNKEFCDKMRNGSIMKTTSVNTYDAEMYFKELLKEGKDILHISFTSGMSGSFNNINSVANEINKTSKNKIYIIDSLCACSGQGLLCLLASEEADKGKDITDVVKYIESIKLNICHLFTVDNLKYLVQGGRVSKVKATIGTVLQIKPVLHLNNEGKIVQCSNVISRKKAIMTLCDDFIKKFSNISDKIIISHADCKEDAELLASFIKKKSNKDCLICELGHVICSHSGPGTLALFFVGNPR